MKLAKLSRFFSAPTKCNLTDDTHPLLRIFEWYISSTMSNTRSPSDTTRRILSSASQQAQQAERRRSRDGTQAVQAVQEARSHHAKNDAPSGPFLPPNRFQPPLSMGYDDNETAIPRSRGARPSSSGASSGGRRSSRSLGPHSSQSGLNGQQAGPYGQQKGSYRQQNERQYRINGPQSGPNGPDPHGKQQTQSGGSSRRSHELRYSGIAKFQEPQRFGSAPGMYRQDPDVIERTQRAQRLKTKTGEELLSTNASLTASGIYPGSGKTGSKRSSLSSNRGTRPPANYDRREQVRDPYQHPSASRTQQEKTSPRGKKRSSFGEDQRGSRNVNKSSPDALTYYESEYDKRVWDYGSEADLKDRPREKPGRDMSHSRSQIPPSSSRIMHRKPTDSRDSNKSEVKYIISLSISSELNGRKPTDSNVTNIRGKSKDRPSSRSKSRGRPSPKESSPSVEGGKSPVGTRSLQRSDVSAPRTTPRYNTDKKSMSTSMSPSRSPSAKGKSQTDSQEWTNISPSKVQVHGRKPTVRKQQPKTPLQVDHARPTEEREQSPKIKKPEESLHSQPSDTKAPPQSPHTETRKKFQQIQPQKAYPSENKSEMLAGKPQPSTSKECASSRQNIPGKQPKMQKAPGQRTEQQSSIPVCTGKTPPGQQISTTEYMIPCGEKSPRKETEQQQPPGQQPPGKQPPGQQPPEQQPPGKQLPGDDPGKEEDASNEKEPDAALHGKREKDSKCFEEDWPRLQQVPMKSQDHPVCMRVHCPSFTAAALMGATKKKRFRRLVKDREKKKRDEKKIRDEQKRIQKEKEEAKKRRKPNKFIKFCKNLFKK